MNQQTLAQSRWWTGLNVALLLCSAVMVLYPPLRHIDAFMLPFSLLLCPAYFITQIRRLKAEGTGNVPISELYRLAKAGRLPKDRLETAAIIAFVLATLHLR